MMPVSGVVRSFILSLSPILVDFSCLVYIQGVYIFWPPFRVYQLRVIEQLAIRIENGNFQGLGSSASQGGLVGGRAAAGEGDHGMAPGTLTTAPGQQGDGGEVKDMGDYGSEEGPSGVLW